MLQIAAASFGPELGPEPECAGTKNSAGRNSLKRSVFSQPYHSSDVEKSGELLKILGWS
jgi:hypothetical protein